ncbi:predicted protein [Sclerotinia sclerotiorum 1980 UF-70]|uniref:Uncharacterized protein n=1 Tax=Sclerotinia sclerotiorum (strain ATCC 18683 / 1980 / Ss-1) TaxID=665079 RepID=A7EN15_SCLS1|nr:predicted protein [Sclerotinia sclerotiorum 1980 UF-70]EDO04231.1 predicted protein [Sclerotinia sclerotiorum 1980 UF-70]
MATTLDIADWCSIHFFYPRNPNFIQMLKLVDGKISLHINGTCPLCRSERMGKVPGVGELTLASAFCKMEMATVSPKTHGRENTLSSPLSSPNKRSALCFQLNKAPSAPVRSTCTLFDPNIKHPCQDWLSSLDEYGNLRFCGSEAKNMQTPTASRI